MEKEKLPSYMVVAVWALLTLAAFGLLMVYGNTPGVPSRNVERWPTSTKIVPGGSKPTLMVFLHPHCACSRATMAELQRLLTHIHDKAKVITVFVRPGERVERWADGDLWQESKSVPQVETVLDEDGKQAELFDARTSGQTILFSADGRVVFRGGITPARGHQGDNVGSSAIRAYVESGRAGTGSSPVFGCALANQDRLPAEEK